MTWEVWHGDALELLRHMRPDSVQCCVTSPPYYGLRDYGVPGQLGLEPTVADYVERLVTVFQGVRRVLRADGTLWLNLGDGYNNRARVRESSHQPGLKDVVDGAWADTASVRMTRRDGDLKEKDLLGVPWQVALALRADGWWLRAEVIWSKPNPMPESVTDRPTRAHEQVFLLARSAHYHYDADAIREPATDRPDERELERRVKNRTVRPGIDVNGGGQGTGTITYPALSRNKRSVWEIPTEPYPDAHFATFPTRLVEPMVLAGCPRGGLVLDPFAGSGTVGVVCGWHGRDFVGAELNAHYVHLARRRIALDGRPSRRPSDPTPVTDGQTSIFDLATP